MVSGKNGDFQSLEANDYQPMPLKQVNDYKANDLNKPMPKEVNDYKAVGGIYQCDNCGGDYTARTVWQKYCPTCSAERKRGVLKSKYKKTNA